MNNVYIKKEELNSWISKYFVQDLISIDNLISVIEDLISEIERYEEKIKDLEQDIEENYERVSISRQVDISDRDFI